MGFPRRQAALDASGLKDGDADNAALGLSPATAATPAVTRWRVKATKSVSTDGRMTTLTEGAEVELAGYGVTGIAALVSQGVQLEPLPAAG